MAIDQPVLTGVEPVRRDSAAAVPGTALQDGGREARLVGLAVGIGLVVIWAYWSTLTEIGQRWVFDPQYSHGFLVPLFAIYLLWRKRTEIRLIELDARWWGVGLIAGGFALRMLGHFFYQPWLDSGSLLVVIAGIFAAAGGRKLFLWGLPAVLFLAFMLPLPYRFQSMLAGTLQQIATVISTYLLQTIGVPAIAEGNVILLSEPPALGIAEACSGLSMLVTFFAIAAGVAILATKNWPEKILVLASAIPIAVGANVFRITLTGVLYESNHHAAARALFHDLAGWIMMPLSLAFLLLELRIFGRLVVPISGAATAHLTQQARKA